MEKQKKRRRGMWIMIIASVLAGVGIVVVVGAVMTTHFVNTPPFTGNDGNILPGSIAEFTRLTLGGNSQAVLIRGKNINNPVMLYLHMGPGLSETGMMRNYHAWLEEYFTMVYLDQRGGGKSYSIFNNPKDFTTAQLVEDVHELTLYLKETFHKEKIAVMGHSFGAPFGLLAAYKYPEDYSLYIGIGQPVDPVECDRLSYAHLIEVATKEGNTKAVKELEKINGYWNTKDTKEYNSGMMVLKKWVGFYGGQIYGAHGPTSFILKNSMCHEFTVFDWLPYFAGMFYAMSASGDIMISTDLRTMAPELKIPVIIMEGRHDINTYPTLVEEYYTLLKAPMKKMYWFEQSAHFPHFEEKDVFQKIMLESVRPLITEEKT